MAASNCHCSVIEPVWRGVRVSDRSALRSASVTHGCHCFSYQKKILESRLAEADGLSFPSFPKASIPMETVTGASILSLEPVQAPGGLDRPWKISSCNLRGSSRSHAVTVRTFGGLASTAPAVRWAAQAPPTRSADWLMYTRTLSTRLVHAVYSINNPNKLEKEIKAKYTDQFIYLVIWS